MLLTEVWLGTSLWHYVRMPMNRHLTWGDRQAELAREKNLNKLKKLAAMAPAPAPGEDNVTGPETQKASATKPKPATVKTKAAPAPAKAKAGAAKKAKPPAKKSTKK